MAEYCMNDDFGFWIPSSVSSTLNSLAAVTWEDFLSKIGVFKRMTAFGQANCTKVLGWFDTLKHHAIRNFNLLDFSL